MKDKKRGRGPDGKGKGLQKRREPRRRGRGFGSVPEPGVLKLRVDHVQPAEDSQTAVDVQPAIDVQAGDVQQPVQSVLVGGSKHLASRTVELFRAAVDKIRNVVVGQRREEGERRERKRKRRVAIEPGDEEEGRRVSKKRDKLISVTFGEKVVKFTKNRSARQVVDHMELMYPPRGALYFMEPDGLVVSSQEDVALSQDNYIYLHPTPYTYPSEKNLGSLKKAVWRLKVVLDGEVVIVGTAVILTEGGTCVSARHCVTEELAQRGGCDNIRVGPYSVQVLADSEDLDLVFFQIVGTGPFAFILLAATQPIAQLLPIVLISFPIMGDTDYVKETPAEIGPSTIHGRVVNIWTSILAGGDYPCFGNCSGGAVVYDGHLVGIHLSQVYEEVEKPMKKKTIGERVANLEANIRHKSALSEFVPAPAIQTFLLIKKIWTRPPHQAPQGMGEGRRKTTVVRVGS